MPRKKKVVLFIASHALPFNGREGKYLGCCSSCGMTLVDWERCSRAGLPSEKGIYVKCGRCTTISLKRKLKEYKCANDGFGERIT